MIKNIFPASAALVCLLLLPPLAGCALWPHMHNQPEAVVDTRYNPGRSLNDEDISEAVRAKFRDSEVLAGYVLAVDTRQGVVTLSGDVNSMEHAAFAADLPVTIYGVRHVISDIVVLP